MRLREADSMAAMAELRQKVAELEIQVDTPALPLRSVAGLLSVKHGFFFRRKRGWSKVS